MISRLQVFTCLNKNFLYPWKGTKNQLLRQLVFLSLKAISGCVILNAVKDPMAFNNNQQSLLWMGFFTSFRMTPFTDVILRASARMIPRLLAIISNHCCAWDSSFHSEWLLDLLWMGFLPTGRQASIPARRRRGFTQNDVFTDVILNAVKDPTAFSIIRLSLLWMGFFTSFRMTAVFYCHPEGFSPKDPSDFSNNQQSLHGMGFFVSLRMTAGFTVDGIPAYRQAGLTLRMTAKLM